LKNIFSTVDSGISIEDMIITKVVNGNESNFLFRLKCAREQMGVNVNY
jgi:hypothetical protein